MGEADDPSVPAAGDAANAAARNQQDYWALAEVELQPRKVPEIGTWNQRQQLEARRRHRLAHWGRRLCDCVTAQVDSGARVGLHGTSRSPSDISSALGHQSSLGGRFLRLPSGGRFLRLRRLPSGGRFLRSFLFWSPKWPRSVSIFLRLFGASFFCD